MSIYKKIGTVLLAVLVAYLLYLVTPGIQNALFPQTPGDDALLYSYEESYEKFLKEELLAKWGRVTLGEYHFNRYGNSAEIQEARTRAGVVSVVIENFWGDDIPEMLTVSLVPSSTGLSYSTLAVDIYEYERKTGKVFLTRRLSDEVSVGEDRISPVTITGAEDTIRVFWRGDFLLMECIGEQHTLTAYHKDRFGEGPEFILRTEEKDGYPTGYYLYDGEDYRSLFKEDEQAEEYLKEYERREETPISEDAMEFLTSSTLAAENFLKGDFKPTWQEDENILWADGRTGYLSVASEDVRMIMTYENHMEGDGSEPLQPAVQIVTDYTEWEKAPSDEGAVTK